MRDVFHDCMHSSCEVDFVLVIHRDADEEFCFSRGISDILAQLVSFGYEVVWVASNGRVSHMCKFDLVPSWQKAVENGRNLTLKNELSVDESHFFLRHLRLSSSSSLLLSIWRWTIMFIVLLGLVIICKSVV